MNVSAEQNPFRVVVNMKEENDPSPSEAPDKEYLIRCPKLGHQIYFGYCRRENMGIPCMKTLDCWYPHFPVVDFLRRELTPDEWKDAFEQPLKPKMVSLVEILDRVTRKNDDSK
ncbi:hypothetical protein ACFL6N_00305 [Thermodesulfobacteriota bacterium]